MKQNIFYRFDSKDNLNETIEAKRRVKTQVPASSNDSLEVKLLYKEAQIKARISQFSSDKHQLKKRLSVLKRNLVQLHSRYQEKMFEVSEFRGGYKLAEHLGRRPSLAVP